MDSCPHTNCCGFQVTLYNICSGFFCFFTRFYAENNANIECPISEAKPNLDVEKVEF